MPADQGLQDMGQVLGRVSGGDHYLKLMQTKGRIEVEDQVGPRSAELLPVSMQEHLAQPAPPIDEDSIPLEPETFVYSLSRFKGDDSQAGPFTLAVRTAVEAPNLLGQMVIYEPPLAVSFSVSTRQYTSPTLEERTAIWLDCLRKSGVPVVEARKRAPEEAAADIKLIKKKLYSCLEWRGGQIRHLEDLKRPQPAQAAAAVDTLKALQDAIGADKLAAILRERGIAVDPAEKAAGEGADGPVPGAPKEPDALRRRAQAPPMS